MFVPVIVIVYWSFPSSHSCRPALIFTSAIVVTDTEDDVTEPMAFTAVTTTVYCVRGDKPVKPADLEVSPLFLVGVVATPFSVYV